MIETSVCKQHTGRSSHQRVKSDVRLLLSLPAAPKVERQGDNSCEVTWEALPPMKGDPVTYTLQCMMGNSEFKQVWTLSVVCSLSVFCVLGALPAGDLPFVTVAF